MKPILTTNKQYRIDVRLNASCLPTVKTIEVQFPGHNAWLNEYLLKLYQLLRAQLNKNMWCFDKKAKTLTNHFMANLGAMVT